MNYLCILNIKYTKQDICWKASFILTCFGFSLPFLIGNSISQVSSEIDLSIYLYYEELADGILETEKSHSLQAGDPGNPVV